jgi:hypothetical protein
MNLFISISIFSFLYLLLICFSTVYHYSVSLNANFNTYVWSYLGGRSTYLAFLDNLLYSLWDRQPIQLDFSLDDLVYHIFRISSERKTTIIAKLNVLYQLPRKNKGSLHNDRTSDCAFITDMMLSPYWHKSTNFLLYWMNMNVYINIPACIISFILQVKTAQSAY